VAPVVFNLVGDLLEPTRLAPAGPPLRLATARDEPGALQDPEVLGDGGKAHPKRSPRRAAAVFEATWMASFRSLALMR
jgi:hypothetical protein